MNYKSVKLTKNQFIIIRRFLEYLDFRVFPFKNSNLTICIHPDWDVVGTDIHYDHYSFNEFIKELYERKRAE